VRRERYNVRSEGGAGLGVEGEKRGTSGTGETWGMVCVGESEKRANGGTSGMVCLVYLVCLVCLVGRIGKPIRGTRETR
jgi:hypothetical protein